MVFKQTPLMDYFIQQEFEFPDCRWDKRFALTQNLNKYWKADLEYRLIKPGKHEKRPQRNIILEVFSSAKHGTGKTTVAVSVAHSGMKLNGLTLECFKNLHWTTAETFKGVEKHNEVGTFHIIDETKLGELSFGIGSKAFLTKLNDIAQVCRMQSLNFIRIMGSEYRYGSINPMYRFNAFQIDEDSEENLVLVQDSDLKYRGFITLKRPDIPKFYKDYEKKKREFMRSTIEGSEDTRFSIMKVMAETLAKNSAFKKSSNRKQRAWAFMELFGTEYPREFQELVISRAVFLSKTKLA
jgi:hypothetical protein